MSLLDQIRGWYTPTPEVVADEKALVIENGVGTSEDKSNVRESSGGGYDPDLGLPASGGGSLYFNRLSTSNRELNAAQQERARELAFGMYESNPLAKAILETTRDLVLGEEPRIASGDPKETRRTEQQTTIDRFWNDHINLMDIKLQQKVLELGMFGEQCWPVEVNPKDGFVRLGYIDPAYIKKVFYDPNNSERAIAVIVYKGQINSREESWYRIIAPNEDPSSQWYGRLTATAATPVGMAPAEGEMHEPPSVSWYEGGLEKSHVVEGDCFYFTVNRVSNAERGRTDLLSLIDWLDAYDQLLFGEVDRGLLMKTFIWDVKLTGYNDKQIEEYRKNNPQPRPASVRYHNEKVEWAAETPDLKSSDSAKHADLILSYISTGARFPKTWLNGTSDTNRATAQEMGAPALARLSLRQKLVKFMLMQVITFVLDQAEMRGLLTKRSKIRGTLQPQPWNIVATLPDLKQNNQVIVAQSLTQIVQALNECITTGIVDVDTARRVVVMLIQELGVHVDIEAIKQKIEENPPVVADAAVDGRDREKTKVEGDKSNSGATPSATATRLKPTTRELVKSGTGQN